MARTDYKTLPSEITGEGLASALTRFTDASERLELRYQALRGEVEGLRAQLREKELEIRRNERLSLLGETAAALAYEIRNPLGAVRLLTSVLKQDLEDRPESLELVQRIDRSLEGVNDIISNVLQFAKDTSIVCTPINLHSLLQEQVSNLERSFGELKIRSSLSLQGNPFIQGDAHFLSQAFRNLLLNAKQAIGTNGEIKISAQDLDPADRGIRITISDSGPGIEPEILEAIFEPFVTRKQEGTGLGLAIVKTIVTRHGGRISATNDCGAKFFVELPRKQANSPTSGSAI